MGLLDDWWNWRQGNAEATAGAANAGTAATMKALRGGLLDDTEREALVSTPAWAGDPGNIGGGLLMAGTFAGRGAKTADLVKLAQAEKMAAGGANAEATRAATGWFQGPDQQWRFEIPDQYSEYRPGRHVANLREQGMTGNPYETGFGGTVGDVLEHNKLYEAYPDLKDTPFYVDPAMTGGPVQGVHGGRFGPQSVALSPEIAPSMQAGKSVLLHELQHEIQRREGFAGGGMPWKAPAGEADALAGRVQQLEKKDAFDGLTRAEQMELEKAQSRLDQIRADERASADEYRRLAGEVEARDVQARMDMTTSQRRAQEPYVSQGIPTERMIVRRRGLLD